MSAEAPQSTMKPSAWPFWPKLVAAVYVLGSAIALLTSIESPGKHGQFAPLLIGAALCVYVPIIAVIQFLYVATARALPNHWMLTALQLWPLHAFWSGMEALGRAGAIVIIPLTIAAQLQTIIVGGLLVFGIRVFRRFARNT